MNSPASLAPFTCAHSPDLPALLQQLNCTLAISTYQAGKVILISASNNRLVQLPRTFKKPMGIAADQQRMAIATQNEVLIFNNARRMAAHYPNQPNTYDALYLPRATYFTGEVDIHDLHWEGDTLWAINTRFSCLATVDHEYSFKPQWKPFFIEKLTPDDHCHLNGVAFDNGRPRFVTALGKTDTAEGWRENKATGGIVIDVARNSVIADGLHMPHSPRIFDGKLYILQSASGELSQVDIATGKTKA
ncbi:MAG: TIGR03032 family protein, partial [Bacteroidota bacterium]